MPILENELHESLAQFLSHEDPLISVTNCDIAVRGADVWGIWEMPLEEVSAVMRRVVELNEG